jgi:hypothetical protein
MNPGTMNPERDPVAGTAYVIYEMSQPREANR